MFLYQRKLAVMPSIIHKAGLLMNRLDGHISAEDEFSLLTLCVDLALDVVDQVELGISPI